MSGITIIHEATDRLSDQIWTFWTGGGNPYSQTVTLRLNYYATRSRQTTRHKMQVVKYWESPASRRATIKAVDVPLPADVRDAAAAALTVEIMDASGTVVQRESWLKVQPS